MAKNNEFAEENKAGRKGGNMSFQREDPRKEGKLALWKEKVAGWGKNLAGLMHQGWNRIPFPALRERRVQFLSSPRFRLAAAFTSTLLLAGFLSYQLATVDKAYEMVIGQEKIAVVRDQNQALAIAAEVEKEKEKALGQPIALKEKPLFKRTKAKNYQLSGKAELKKKLNKDKYFLTEGTALYINGRQKVVFLNKKMADLVVKKIAASYLQGYNNVTIEKVEFLDKVEFKKKKIGLDQVTPPEKAVEILKAGEKKVQQYTVVEGDSVWLIARKHDTYIKNIEEANPDVDFSKIKPGQVINITRVEPVLKMRVLARVVATETIAYPVKIEKDRNLLMDREKVKQEGKPGSKEVTYRLALVNGHIEGKEVLAEKVIQEPVPKIVVKGTGFYLASRGNGGSGVLGWPVSGPVRSGFGPRGGGFHRGIDIGAPRGTPVGAAAAGTVTFVGWSGGYGNTVIIDHGNGLRTLYAHLSGFNVSPGAYVQRGQIIGFVGATGRATGYHLHFEVHVNGVAQNPLNFLS